MEVEARLLLYTVALGAAVGLAQLVRRRAWEFHVYIAQLAVLLSVAIAGCLVPSLTRAVAWPVFWVFVAVAILPSSLLEIARWLAGRRRYDPAALASGAGAMLLGRPGPLAREADLFAALASAERGDDARCRARLERVKRLHGIPLDLGGDALLRVLPAAARRDWDDVLAALADAPVRPPLLLALEARAAAETGDLRRVARACREIEAHGDTARMALASARRWLLAASGRAAFLEEAVSRRMPVMFGPAGVPESAVARAHEASGDAGRAAAAYAHALRRAHGSARGDAAAGLVRCTSGAPRVVRATDLDPEALAAVEAACRTQMASLDEGPLLPRAPATITITAVTAVFSIGAFLLCDVYFGGIDTISVLAAGALSEQLIALDGQWWRLSSTLLLHGGWVHLAMNLAAILFIGVPFESRAGGARLAIVYMGAGLLASLASAFANHTQVGVGASGAAMGLIGAFAVLVLERRRSFPPDERRRWLIVLAMTVAATFGIGFLEHESIDNMAHGAGLVAGALVGWMVLRLPDGRPGVRAGLRAVAGALCAVLVVCAFVAASHVRDWRGEREVRFAAVRAAIPAWLLDKTAPEAGLVAWRRPVPFALQIGSDPVEPDASLLLPIDQAEWPRLLAAGPTETSTASGEDGLEMTTADYAEPDGEGFRARTFRRGARFAVVVLPIGPDEGSGWDELARRIGSSLRGGE